MNPQRGTRTDDTSADQRPVGGSYGQRRQPAAEGAAILDASDDTDSRIAAVELGNKHDLIVCSRVRSGLGLLGLKRHRDHHLRKNNAPRYRHQGESCRLGAGSDVMGDVIRCRISGGGVCFRHFGASI